MSRSFDSRTIEEVERSRNRTNRKPYRSKAARVEASNHAYRNKRGHWTSSVPAEQHPEFEEDE